MLTNAIFRKLSTLSLQKKDPRISAPKYTHKTKTKNKQTNLTTGYTLCDVNTEDTIRHNTALITSTSRIYIPYPLGTIIK